MRINQLKAGVILSYATQAVYVLSGLIYTPVMLRLLGQNEYGLYQLVTSVISYLGLLSFGFASSYVRFYSRYKANSDSEGVAKLNGMFMSIFSVIAVICVICGAVMMWKADVIFGSGILENEIGKARILMLMMIINMVMSFIVSPFSSYITVHEKFFFQRVLEFFKTLLNPFITLPLLVMGYGSVGMVGVSVLLTVISLCLNIYYSIKKLSMRFVFKAFDFSLLKEMWIFTFFIFLSMIIDQLNWSIDKFLLGRIIGKTAVAVYGVASQLNAMYMNFSMSVSGVFVPRVNMLAADEEDNHVMTELFLKVARVQFIIVMLIVTGYVFFGREFIAIWAGDGYESSYKIGLFLMLPAVIPLVQSLGVEIQRAKNLHKARSVVYLLIAVSNIFVSIPCIRLWGAEGAAIGTAITLIIGTGIFMNIYYHKKVGLNMIYFWKGIFKFAPAMVLVCIAGGLISYVPAAGNLLILTGKIFIYILIYIAVMWFSGMNKSEKELVQKPLGKIYDKLRRK